MTEQVTRNDLETYYGRHEFQAQVPISWRVFFFHRRFRSRWPRLLTTQYIILNVVCADLFFWLNQFAILSAIHFNVKNIICVIFSRWPRRIVTSFRHLWPCYCTLLSIREEKQHFFLLRIHLKSSADSFFSRTKATNKVSIIVIGAASKGGSYEHGCMTTMHTVGLRTI